MNNHPQLPEDLNLTSTQFHHSQTTNSPPASQAELHSMINPLFSRSYEHPSIYSPVHHSQEQGSYDDQHIIKRTYFKDVDTYSIKSSYLEVLEGPSASNGALRI